MKTLKKCTCLFLALILAFLSVPKVYAENSDEPTDFEQTDRPMLYNTTDSSKLPGYDLSDVYGQVEAPEAEVMDSMFSDEAWDRFSSDLDLLTGFTPAEDQQVAAILGKVESFIGSGGVSSYLEGGDLLMGVDIGLSENKEEKVKVLGTESNSSDWVYVVGKDALCFVVRDKTGEGIANALVTISYTENGNRITKTAIGTAGNVPGIVVFDDIPKNFYGIVDVHAEGYRAVSVLDKYMAQGEHYVFELESSKNDDLYIRGIDLSGKDMVNEETKLLLVEGGTEDLTLKVLVTKSGSRSFPSEIEIYSDNRKETVLKIDSCSPYDYDSNTRVYTASRRWAEQGDLFKEGDEASVRFGGEVFAIEHLTVENSVIKPGVSNIQMPVTTEEMPGNVSDRMGGTGFLNITAQILQVPVTIGFFPNGDAILMASYDITQLDKNTQYKFNSLFDKSWNPKTLSDSEPAFQVFQKSFWENAEKVKGGKAALDSPDKVKMLRNSSYDFSMSFSLFLRSSYNKETGDSFGTGGLIFTGGITGGITEYFLFVAGPVVIPAYIGFEAGFSIKTSLNLNFNMDKPPVGEENDTKWKYATESGKDLQDRIEVLVSFSVFGGVGVKGVLGASATGYVNMDIATVLGKGKASIFTAEPHSFIDLLYGLRFDYYLLFFSGSIMLDCLNGAKRIYDSNGEADLLSDAESQLELKPMSLSDCADEMEPLLGDGESDRAFRLIGNDPLSSQSSIEDVDPLTYPDNQIQFAATKNETALFRLLSDGDRTWIAYQMMDKESGHLETTAYMVELPDGRSVSEFVVVPNKTDRDDPNYCDNVYIGAVLVDNSIEDVTERARSTDVAAMVVDLSSKKTRSSMVVSAPDVKGTFLYSAPKPAGARDYCVMAYVGSFVEDAVSQEDLLSAMSSQSYNFLSTCAEDDPANRKYKMIGMGRVHSSGAIAPNEPCFWLVDQIQSTDKTLYVKGYGSNGYYNDNDPRCRFYIDISGTEVVDFNYDPILNNWQYLNGCNYFIAGDSIYWMNKETTGDDPASYTWKVEKVRGGSGLISADNRYSMITNNEQSAIYLVGVAGDYEVDMENGTAKKTSNRIMLYTLVTENRIIIEPELICSVHGPLSLNFAYGETITHFAAAYDQYEGGVKGLSIVYSSPIISMSQSEGKGPLAKTDEAQITAAEDEERGEAAKASSIRMWKQNASKGMRVTKIKIREPLITKDAAYIAADVWVRNYGYAREGHVMFRAYDEEGHRLALTNGKRDLTDEDYFYMGDLFTGDEKSIGGIYIKPYPGWQQNTEHEITVEVIDRYYYNGDLDDLVNSDKLAASNISITAENSLIGGKHYVSITAENNTVIGTEMPKVLAVFDYDTPERSKTMTFSLPAEDALKLYDGEEGSLSEQIYHMDIDFDQIWEDGVKEGLKGVYFSLVDGEGTQVSNETIYLKNPEELREDAQPDPDDPVDPVDPPGPVDPDDPVGPPSPDEPPKPDAPDEGPWTGDRTIYYIRAAAVSLAVMIWMIYGIWKTKRKEV